MCVLKGLLYSLCGYSSIHFGRKGNCEDMQDNGIDHPAYYNQGNIEAIDFIENLPYNEGAAIKYIVRHRYKGEALKDLRKARWYVNRLIQNEEARLKKEDEQREAIVRDSMEKGLRNAAPQNL